VRAQITLDEISTVEASLSRARERVGDVVIRSPANGRFVVPLAGDLPGRFVEQGERIGYVVGPSIATVRVVLPQSQASLVRERTQAVDVRLSPRVGEVLPASIEREVPAATDRLPSRALGIAGGGRLRVDPADPDGLQTLERVFQLDLALPSDAYVGEIGGRRPLRSRRRAGGAAGVPVAEARVPESARCLAPRFARESRTAPIPSEARLSKDAGSAPRAGSSGTSRGAGRRAPNDGRSSCAQSNSTAQRSGVGPTRRSARTSRTCAIASR
jgi:hypothetical protein